MRISDWSSDVCSSDRFGAVDLSVARLFGAAIGEGDRVASVILFDLRLPRTLLELGVGAMLGLAGAALPGYLRNPLADPSVLGPSHAAESDERRAGEECVSTCRSGLYPATSKKTKQTLQQNILQA